MNILELPVIYNLRWLVCGDQANTKSFILKNYKKFKCTSVLDIGCGTGDFTSLFKSKGYLGIDVNSKYVSFAKRKNQKHNFLTQDVDAFKTGTDFFDCSVFISTMHHLSNSQIKRILKKTIKITKQVIIIVDLNPETDPIRKFLVEKDRGEFVRTTAQKIKLLKPFGQIIEVAHFNTRLASQSGIILKPKS